MSTTPVFTHVAAPGRTLHGVVTDDETGTPVAGVRVKTTASWMSMQNPVTTGADGRYEINDVPKQDEYRIDFEPTSTLHFNRQVRVVDRPGLQPIDVTASLVSGVRVRGRVTDAETGDPLAGRVIYSPLYPNDNASFLGEASRVPDPAATALIEPDGSFEITVLPGPGVIAARVRGQFRSGINRR